MPASCDCSHGHSPPRPAAPWLPGAVEELAGGREAGEKDVLRDRPGGSVGDADPPPHSPLSGFP